MEQVIEMAELMKDFIRAYCERSGITEERYHQMKVTLPCACDAVDGPHWAAVVRDPAGILDHIAFHSPTKDEILTMSHDETKHILAVSASGDT